MLRFLLRLVGFMSWVGALALIVIDGTRSIAAREMETLPLSALLGDRLALLAASVQDDYLLLWSVLSGILAHLPSSLFFIALGALALWLGRPPQPEYGLDELA